MPDFDIINIEDENTEEDTEMGSRFHCAGSFDCCAQSR